VTLLSHYKGIKQEIVHTLLLEEYGVSKKWVIIMSHHDRSGTQMRLRLQQEKRDLALGPGIVTVQNFRRRREERAWSEEMAWKRKRIKTKMEKRLHGK